MKNLIDYRQDARELVKQLYKDETGKPIILTDGQCDIFNIIFKRFTPRNHIATFTRYGKSLVTALAILTRVSTFPEKFALVAGNDDQARIIMSYVIQHIFDNEYTKTRFLVGKGESEENIRRYKNKDRLNFVIKREKGEKMLLGELFITNAQGALGFGCVPKGYKVLTDKGEIEISELVETMQTSKVFSFNHETNKIELQNIISYQKNPLGNRDLIEIDLGDRKIVCTEDHPVWIKNKGYVKAKDLIIGDSCMVLG
jgi:hypothetical protein